MDQANASTNDLTKSLIALGETKLALRVAVCNLKTHIIAVRGNQLRRKMEKHNLAIQRQEIEVDHLATIVPTIILSHQK